ncbi:hypothetical protein Daus18300_001057 [Diaporthe australafricana]|uniref:2EXR domain-containing protein n=1 Tax=Diaporthe australafricana TaxID=127596 RepID=A0ABR3XYW1_9PEZI
MDFHLFQQLPAELRQMIWECAIHELRPICRVVGPPSWQRDHRPRVRLITYEDFTLRCVNRESRDALRRLGRLSPSRNYEPESDALYVGDYDDCRALVTPAATEIRHIALSSHFCYEVLKIRGLRRRRGFDELGWPHGLWVTFLSMPEAHVFVDALKSCHNLETITVVFPLLEGSMPHFADKSDLERRPSFLQTVPYSETQNIRIRGHHSYTTWLRGGSNTLRRCLGPFIKDVNERCQKDIELLFGDDDPRRAITVHAGVLQHLEGPSADERKLSSIYKVTEEMGEEEKNRSANEGGKQA